MTPPLVQRTAVRLEERGYPVIVTEFSHQTKYVLDFRLFVSQGHTESTSTFVFDEAGEIQTITLRLPPLTVSRVKGREVLDNIMRGVSFPCREFVWLSETDRGLEPHIRCIPRGDDQRRLLDAHFATILRLDRIAAQHVGGLNPN